MKKLLSLLSVLLLSTQLCLAADTATDNTLETNNTVNNGGLNTKASNFALKDNESPDCQNVYFGIDGGFAKRKGFAQLDDHPLNSTADVTGVYQYTQKDGDTYLIETAGNKVGFSTSFSTVSWSDHITGNLTITPEALFDFDTLNDVCVFTNGEDPPMQWTGSGNAEHIVDVPTNLTKAKWVTTFENRMFFGNVYTDTDMPSRIYWSALKDPTSWNALDYLDISTDDGEEIMGMEVLADRLVVFKESSVFNVLYTGDPDIPFVVGQSGSSAGAASGYTIKPVGAGLVYMSYDGLYLYDGMYSGKISYNVDTIFVTGMNRGEMGKFVAETYDDLNQLWLSYVRAGQTEKDRILVWDYFNNAFTLYKGISANTLCSVSVTGEERLFSGNIDGHLYRQNTALNDNGTAIEAYYWTKWFDFGRPLENKAVKHAVVYLENVGDYAINVGYNWNFADGVWRSIDITMNEGVGYFVGTAIVGTAYASEEGGIVRRLDLSGSGKVFRLRFYNNGLNEEFHVRGFALTGEFLGIR